jgi:hypothetical protein
LPRADENKSAPAATAAPAEEHSRFIPALGAPHAEDGTPLRPTPAGPSSGPPPATSGASIPAEGPSGSASAMPPPNAFGITRAASVGEPVGATPRAIAPAIQAGAPPVPRADTPPPASAKSYSVTRYECQAGDTFQSVSKQYFRREDYATALQAYNRVDSHRCGSPTLSSDGKLKAGDVVYVPMLAALESEYSSYLPRPETAPTSFPAPGH